MNTKLIKNNMNKLSKNARALKGAHQKMGKFLNLLSTSKEFADNFEKAIKGKDNDEIINYIKNSGIPLDGFSINIKTNYRKKELVVWFCIKEEGCLGVALGYVTEIIK